MSEYTDYLIYRTDAVAVEVLRSEVAQLAGSGIIVSGAFPDGAASLEAVLKTPGPAWVAVLPPTSLKDMRADPLAWVYVLEDFASWRLEVRCAGTIDVFQFGTDDGYALGWSRENFAAPFVTDRVDPATIDRLAGCFQMQPEAMQPMLAYGKVWDFLTLAGAPSVQMLDQTIALYDLEEAEPGVRKVLFDWEVW